MIPGGGECVDTDNYDGYLDNEAQCFWDQGIRAAWVGYQVPEIADRQIENYHKVGIQVLNTYAYLYFGCTSFLGAPWDGVGYEVQKAIDGAKKYGIPRVCLDIEAVPPYEAPGVTSGFRVQETHRAVQMVETAGLEPIIYTYKPYWVNQMENTFGFSKYKLIFAAYYYDLHHQDKVDFGGWTDIWIHQYMSTGTNCYVNTPGVFEPMPPLCGINVDYCKIIGEIEDMSLIDDLKKEIEDLKLAVFAGAEETNPDRAARLANADYRIDQIVQSKGNSVADIAASAMVLAKQSGNDFVVPDLSSFSKKGHTHQVQGDQ